MHKINKFTYCVATALCVIIIITVTIIQKVIDLVRWRDER